MNRLTSGMMAILLCLLGLLFLQPLMQTTGLGGAEATADDESATDVLAIQTEVADPTADNDAPNVSGDQASVSVSNEALVQDELADPKVAEPAASEAAGAEAAESNETPAAAAPQRPGGRARSALGGGMRIGRGSRRTAPPAGGLLSSRRGRGTFRLEETPVDSGASGVWTKNIGVTWSEEQDELYGFSTKTGSWSTLKITPQETIVPVVNNSLAVVAMGNQFAAFSGTVGGWDVLELDYETDAVPTVHTQHIALRTEKHLYTFAEGLGKWTSPTDPNVQKLAGALYPGPAQVQAAVTDVELEVDDATSSASQIHVDRVEAMMLGALVGDLEAHSKRTEKESIETAKKLQARLSRLGSNHPETKQLTDQLRDAVTRAYTARNQLQKQRMKALEDRLAKIRASLEARSKLQERIIERRVEELLDPNVDWQAMRSSTPTERRRGLRVGSMLDDPPILPTLPKPTPPRVDDTGGLSAPAQPIEVPVSAKEMFEVPDLIGMSQKHAVILLHELGLKNSKIGIDRDARARGPVDAHRVLTQQPEPGTQIDTETTVTISLGRRGRSKPGETWTWDRPSGSNAEESTTAGRATGVTSAASTPHPFDWDEIERLRARLDGSSSQVADSMQKTTLLMREIDIVSVAWADASQEERRTVAGILLTDLGQRSMKWNLGITVDSSQNDDGDHGAAVNELIDDEEQFEEQRVACLDWLRPQLDGQLKYHRKQLQHLELWWTQYQAMIEDHKLNVRQAVLEQQVASEKFDTVMQAAEKGAFTRTQVSDYKLAMDKAQINQERAESYLDRIQQIGKDNPQFDPAPYQTFVQQAQQQLAKLQPQSESDTPAVDDLDSF